MIVPYVKRKSNSIIENLPELQIQKRKISENSNTVMHRISEDNDMENLNK